MSHYTSINPTNSENIPFVLLENGSPQDSLLQFTIGPKLTTDLLRSQEIKDQAESSFKIREEKKHLLADLLEESGLIKPAKKVRACNRKVLRPLSRTWERRK